MTKEIKRGSDWTEKKTSEVYKLFDFCEVCLVRGTCDGVMLLKDDKFTVMSLKVFREKFVYHGHFYYKGTDICRLKNTGWDPS